MNLGNSDPKFNLHEKSLLFSVVKHQENMNESHWSSNSLILTSIFYNHFARKDTAKHLVSTKTIPHIHAFLKRYKHRDGVKLISLKFPTLTIKPLVAKIFSKRENALAESLFVALRDSSHIVKVGGVILQFQNLWHLLSSLSEEIDNIKDDLLRGKWEAMRRLSNKRKKSRSPPPSPNRPTKIARCNSPLSVEIPSSSFNSSHLSYLHSLDETIPAKAPGRLHILHNSLVRKFGPSFTHLKPDTLSKRLYRYKQSLVPTVDTQTPDATLSIVPCSASSSKCTYCAGPGKCKCDGSRRKCSKYLNRGVVRSNQNDIASYFQKDTTLH
jgi:hypothetical protein